MTDSRYPYTYACDFIRNLGPFDSTGVVLTRSEASQIMSGIAKALSIDDEELANKLADAQLKNEDDPEILKMQAQRLLAALGYVS